MHRIGSEWSAKLRRYVVEKIVGHKFVKVGGAPACFRRITDNTRAIWY